MANQIYTLDNRSAIFDALCVLNDASIATLTADAAGKLAGGTPAVFDTGGGFTKGELVIDAAFVASARVQDGFMISLQGSNTGNFADEVALVQIDLGAVGRTAHAVKVTAGRYKTPFRNMFGDTVYQYLRVYAKGLGTWATGIKYSAFITAEE